MIFGATAMVDLISISTWVHIEAKIKTQYIMCLVYESEMNGFFYRRQKEEDFLAT
jgi:hypothetical protein